MRFDVDGMVFTCIKSEFLVFLHHIEANDGLHLIKQDDTLLLALRVRTRNIVSAFHDLKTDVLV